MKTIKNPSAIFRYKGKICEVTGIATDKVIFFRELGKRCRYCGKTKDYAEVESSPNFQENAEAVNTLGVDTLENDNKS